MKNKEENKPRRLMIPLVNLYTFITYLLLLGFGLIIGIACSTSYYEIPYVFKYFSLKQVPTLILPSTAITKTTVILGDQKNETLAQSQLHANKLISNSCYPDDKELLERALKASTSNRNSLKRVPKIAFLFLTRESLPLAPLWEKFFRGNHGLFSIYVHSSPSFNKTMSTDSVFYSTSIPSKQVDWGKFNMVEAERRLLANALLEPSNQRFILLSESCIPLFNFSTIYSYLMNSTQTFVESYDLRGPTGQGRYRRRLKPLVNLRDWRKGSQWFEMDRNLATKVISDVKYFPKFMKTCRSAKCYGDEHYFATFVSMNFGVNNSNRSLTWVDWSRGGYHPFRFGTSVTVELLNRLRYGKKCKYNGRITTICFLFARKFSPKTLDTLLRFAPKVMSF